MEKNNKIVILIGISNAGKSTWTENFLRNNLDYVRVSRDSFRFMLRNEGMTEPKIESLITDLSISTINTLLSKRLNVIVDNTHLNHRDLNSLINEFKTKADIEFKIFDISLAKALERNRNRDRKVPEEVIEKMYNKFKVLMDTFEFKNLKKQKHIYVEPVFDKNLEDIVIFDLDGTLAKMNGKRGPYDWDKVFVDDLDFIVADQLRLHYKNGSKIFIVSGRDDVCRKDTEDWLKFHNLDYFVLYMRPKDDRRKDSIVKKEIYDKYIKDKYNVKIIYDDRDQVVDLYRSLGLKVFQVEKGNF